MNRCPVISNLNDCFTYGHQFLRRGAKTSNFPGICLLIICTVQAVLFPAVLGIISTGNSYSLTGNFGYNSRTFVANLDLVDKSRNFIHDKHGNALELVRATFTCGKG